MSLSNNTEIILKLQRFCVYQTRCKEDVRQKMIRLNVKEHLHDNIIEKLQENGFIDEADYLTQFTNGKFHFKKWGKQKIKAHLISKKIASEKIEHCLNLIVTDEYIRTINYLIEKKIKELKVQTLTNKRIKISRYLIQKGFAPIDFLPILDSRLE
ncbi:MAG TPA: RecX family transcriptional regulator [Bacteroidetes bacterium]|nr:RecX family transcriptional regulator [Bacteroidota bacterium]